MLYASIPNCSLIGIYHRPCMAKKLSKWRYFPNFQSLGLTYPLFPNQGQNWYERVDRWMVYCTVQNLILTIYCIPRGTQTTKNCDIYQVYTFGGFCPHPFPDRGQIWHATLATFHLYRVFCHPGGVKKPQILPHFHFCNIL